MERTGREWSQGECIDLKLTLKNFDLRSGRIRNAVNGKRLYLHVSYCRGDGLSASSQNSRLLI